MQKRVAIWGTFAALLVGFWLIIALWAMRDGDAKDKKAPEFDPSMFDKFKHGFPPPEEP
jgi:hypothetical protein